MTTFVLRAISDHPDPTQQTTVNFHYHLPNPHDLASHLDYFRRFLHAAGVPEEATTRLFLNPLDDLK